MLEAAAKYYQEKQAWIDACSPKQASSSPLEKSIDIGTMEVIADLRNYTKTQKNELRFLFWAAFRGKLEIVKHLMKMKISPFVRHFEGKYFCYFSDW